MYKHICLYMLICLYAYMLKYAYMLLHQFSKKKIDVKKKNILNNIPLPIFCVLVLECPNVTKNTLLGKYVSPAEFLFKHMYR